MLHASLNPLYHLGVTCPLHAFLLGRAMKLRMNIVTMLLLGLYAFHDERVHFRIPILANSRDLPGYLHTRLTAADASQRKRASSKHRRVRLLNQPFTFPNQI